MTPVPCSDIPQALSLDPFPSLAVSTGQTSALHSRQTFRSVKHHQLPPPPPRRSLGGWKGRPHLWCLGRLRGLYQVFYSWNAGVGVPLPCSLGKEIKVQRMSHSEAGTGTPVSLAEATKAQGGWVSQLRPQRSSEPRCCGVTSPTAWTLPLGD